MNDKEWQEAKERGSKPDALAFALSDAFEMLGEHEQDAIFEEIIAARKSPSPVR